MGLNIFCGIILCILETPFYFKIRRAKYDIIRQTAIAIIMGIIIPLIVYVLYIIGSFVLE